MNEHILEEIRFEIGEKIYIAAALVKKNKEALDASNKALRKLHDQMICNHKMESEPSVAEIREVCKKCDYERWV